jgi:hypothetical protein
MRTKFWKGCLVALTAYALGYWALLDLSMLFLLFHRDCVLAWSAFADFRIWSLARREAYRPDAAEWDREDFGFWLGAVLSSVLLSALFLVTPVRVR